MASPALVITSHGGQYVVVNEHGSTIGEPRSRPAAIRAAIRYLNAHGGGTFSVREADGAETAPTRVDGASRVEVARSPAVAATAPTQNEPPKPGAVQASTSQSERPDERSTLRDRAEKIAKVADDQLGLKEPDYGDLEVGKLLGATGQHPTVKLVNSHVSFASGWLIIIAIVSGSGAGTIASVVHAVTRGTQGKATVGAYADVAVVFITAFALCTIVAALIYLVREGAIKGYGAVLGVCLGIVLWCWFLNGAGIASPDPDDLLLKPRIARARRLRGPTPPDSLHPAPARKSMHIAAGTAFGV